uniref:Nucleolar protein 4 n=1 Tax=Bracon brevicornis TaxID=1563983 RepID=A0A6V7KFU9_9HYME
MTSVMGLRRRVPVNTASPITPTSSKRSRAENNNNPSHGNLNSLNNRDEATPAKKSRSVSNGVKNNLNVTGDNNQMTKGRGSSKGSRVKSPMIAPTVPPTNAAIGPTPTEHEINGFNVLTSTPWPVGSMPPDVPVTYGTISGLVAGAQTSLCSSSLAMPTPIPYMASSMATFVGTATNLNKNSSVSYLDISNMTSGSLGGSSSNSGMTASYGNCKKTTSETTPKSQVSLPPFSGVVPAAPVSYNNAKSQQQQTHQSPQQQQPQQQSHQKQQQQQQQQQREDTKSSVVSQAMKFQNDTMFNAYQPWVIKTYGDLAKTKTITIKKYARILRTLRGEEVNSADNSKFRFWVKSKGFHIGQPEGYDAKPADRIIGRHAVTSPGLDPPLYVPTQLPHNKVSL